MEKAMSVEEKIRRAEEIYARRHSNDIKPSATVKVNDYSNKKDIKLLKKNANPTYDMYIYIFNSICCSK